MVFQVSVRDGDTCKAAAQMIVNLFTDAVKTQCIMVSPDEEDTPSGEQEGEPIRYVPIGSFPLTSSSPTDDHAGSRGLHCVSPAGAVL